MPFYVVDRNRRLYELADPETSGRGTLLGTLPRSMDALESDGVSLIRGKSGRNIYTIDLDNPADSVVLGSLPSSILSNENVINLSYVGLAFVNGQWITVASGRRSNGSASLIVRFSGNPSSARGISYTNRSRRITSLAGYENAGYFSGRESSLSGYTKIEGPSNSRILVATEDRLFGTDGADIFRIDPDDPGSSTDPFGVVN